MTSKPQLVIVDKTGNHRQLGDAIFLDNFVFQGSVLIFINYVHVPFLFLQMYIRDNFDPDILVYNFHTLLPWPY